MPRLYPREFRSCVVVGAPKSTDSSNDCVHVVVQAAFALGGERPKKGTSATSEA